MLERGLASLPSPIIDWQIERALVEEPAVVRKSPATVTVRGFDRNSDPVL